MNSRLLLLLINVTSFFVSLVFRLVPKPNCVKVPKEICVNSKTNPRVVKKPVIKDWCYRPSELKETPEIIPPSPDTTAPGFLF